MRNSLFILFFLVSTALSAQSISDKLVAYFSFDTCAVSDDSGNNSSGAPVGATIGSPPYCVCGPKGQSIHLDGLDDGILFVGPMNDVFSINDFSISFYMKPFPQSGTQIIMSKQNACDQNNAFWVRYSHATNTISSGISEDAASVATVAGKLDPDPCWEFIVITRANRTFNLYINGVLKDSKTSSERIDLSSNEIFSIAKKVCDQDKLYRGELDEVRIYKKALTLDEIKLLDLRPDQISNRDTLIYLGNSFDAFITQSCAQSFEWTPREGVADPMGSGTTITPTTSTVYYIQSKHPECVASDSIVVTVIDPDTLDCSKIFIPNAFTPGGSFGRNDQFFISNPFAVDQFISFEIYDRWGGKVYEFKTKFDAWDGTFQGKPVNPGIFLYRLRYKCDGEEKSLAGSVTVVR